jgi:hypothetical protein
MLLQTVRTGDPDELAEGFRRWELRFRQLGSPRSHPSSGPEAFLPGRCHMVPLGAIWVPHGATSVAPKIKKRVAPWRCWRRLALGKLVVVKCHLGCHLVPPGSDHSPPAWHLGGHSLAKLRI